MAHDTLADVVAATACASQDSSLRGTASRSDRWPVHFKRRLDVTQGHGG